MSLLTNPFSDIIYGFKNIFWNIAVIAADYAPWWIEAHDQEPKAKGQTYCKEGSPARMPFKSGFLSTVFTINEAHLFTLIHLAF
jgi:hypothetical protein